LPSRRRPWRRVSTWIGSSSLRAAWRHGRLRAIQCRHTTIRSTLTQER